MKCPTCFELLISDTKNYVVTTPCGHLFHNDCVQAWLDRGNQSCPQCRTGITKEKLIRLYSFETTTTDAPNQGTLSRGIANCLGVAQSVAKSVGQTWTTVSVPATEMLDNFFSFLNCMLLSQEQTVFLLIPHL